jgi:Lhr-like helicase
MAARTGKIARLPKEIRDVVNHMLRDGSPASAIIKRLEALKLKGATAADGLPIEIPTDMNLSNWKEGGYQDWLREQERLEEMRLKREMALELVRQNEGSKIHEAAIQLASSQLYEVISEYDLGSLKGLLQEKPENFANLVNSLAKLSKGALDIEKYRDLVKAQKEKIEAAIKEGKSQKGFTKETIEKIERELKLL